MYPRPSFVVSQNSLACQFTDTSDDSRGGGSIVSRLWDFGDLGTSILQNPSHTFLAPGGYPVSLTVTDNEGLQATASQLVTVTNLGVGIPVGLYRLYNGTVLKTGAARFAVSQDFTGPANFAARLASARATGTKLILMMTDGDVSQYGTVAGGFDVTLAKWKQNGADPWNQQVYKDLVVEYADVIQWNSVMDEPMHKRWSPGGTGDSPLTKALIDAMCDYMNGIFPGLICGMVGVHWWKGGIGPQTRQNPLQWFEKCQVILDQYDWWQPPNGNGTSGPHGGGNGNYLDWIQAVRDFQTRERANSADHKAPAIWLSQNISDGGSPDQTPMDPAEVRTFGLALVNSGLPCGFQMYQYDASMVASPAYQQAFDDIIAAAARVSRPVLARS